MIWSLLSPLFLVRPSFCQLKQCWGVDGLRDDLPCDPSANVSSCCAQNWTCETKFYCVGPNNIGKMTGSCTDITWHDPACPLLLSQSIISPLHPVIAAL